MELQKWIKDTLDKKKGKTSRGLGLAICNDASVGSKILNGKRAVKVDELGAISAYLEEPIPQSIIPIAVSDPRESLEYKSLLTFAMETWKSNREGKTAAEVVEIVDHIFDTMKDKDKKEKAAGISAILGYPH